MEQQSRERGQRIYPERNHPILGFLTTKQLLPVALVQTTAALQIGGVHRRRNTGNHQVQVPRLLAEVRPPSHPPAHTSRAPLASSAAAFTPTSCDGPPANPESGPSGRAGCARAVSPELWAAQSRGQGLGEQGSRQRICRLPRELPGARRLRALPASRPYRRAPCRHPEPMAFGYPATFAGHPCRGTGAARVPRPTGAEAHQGRRGGFCPSAERQHQLLRACWAVSWGCRRGAAARRRASSDCVFVEDVVVVCEETALVTRPRAPSRRKEVTARPEKRGCGPGCLPGPSPTERDRLAREIAELAPGLVQNFPFRERVCVRKREVHCLRLLGRRRSLNAL